MESIELLIVYRFFATLREIFFSVFFTENAKNEFYIEWN